MSYTKVEWKDGKDGGTPLSAENLNVMDNGISAIDESIADIVTKVDEVEISLNELNESYSTFAENTGLTLQNIDTTLKGKYNKADNLEFTNGQYLSASKEENNNKNSAYFDSETISVTYRNPAALKETIVDKDGITCILGVSGGPSARTIYKPTGISYHNNDILLPEKAGTIALQEDLNEIKINLNNLIQNLKDKGVIE